MGLLLNLPVYQLVSKAEVLPSYIIRHRHFLQILLPQMF